MIRWETCHWLTYFPQKVQSTKAVPGGRIAKFDPTNMGTTNLHRTGSRWENTTTGSNPTPTIEKDLWIEKNQGKRHSLDLFPPENYACGFPIGQFVYRPLYSQNFKEGLRKWQKRKLPWRLIDLTNNRKDKSPQLRSLSSPSHPNPTDWLTLTTLPKIININEKTLYTAIYYTSHWRRVGTLPFGLQSLTPQDQFQTNQNSNVQTKTCSFN